MRYPDAMDVHKRVSARTWRAIVDGAITTSNDGARSDPLPITNGGTVASWIFQVGRAHALGMSVEVRRGAILRYPISHSSQSGHGANPLASQTVPANGMHVYNSGRRDTKGVNSRKYWPAVAMAVTVADYRVRPSTGSPAHVPHRLPHITNSVVKEGMAPLACTCIRDLGAGRKSGCPSVARTSQVVFHVLSKAEIHAALVALTPPAWDEGLPATTPTLGCCVQTRYTVQ